MPDTFRRRFERQGFRRKIMKSMFLAAAVVLTVGTSVANAGEGAPSANTQFTSIPGVVAQAPVQTVPSVALSQNGQGMQAFVARSSQGTWLFPPAANGNG